MKNFLVCILCLLCLFSCKREYSFEQGKLSAGNLEKDAAGNCAPMAVSGSFIAREAINTNNYAEVSVHVTSTGGYTITTDTINGYSFNASGSFSDTGTFTVKLKPQGKPLQQGINDFTVNYNTSQCILSVTVDANPADPAAFILSGAPAQCMNALVGGVFIKGVATDTSNKVKIGLVVTTPGAYTITTNTVNGYSFSGSGSLAAAGLQFVTLAATGTPLTPGTDNFTVTAGASSCNFNNTVSSSVTVINNDYFPLTNNSFWTYDNTSYPNDSIERKIIDTATRNGHVYKVMDERIPFRGHQQLFFRKDGSDYHEYASVDKYTGSVTYSPSLLADIPFLKENIVAGDAWMSAEFSATASFGQVILIRYSFSCVAANSTASINGNNFVNVHKLRMRPEIRSLSGPWGGTFEVYDLYYAKGVGLIYVKKARNNFVESEQFLRRWQVN